MLDLFGSLLSWFTPVAALIVLGITYVRLHEPKDSPRRVWRDVVLGVSAVIAISGFVAAWKSGKLAAEISLLRRVVASDDLQISELESRLMKSEASLSLLGHASRADDERITSLKRQLALSERERAVQAKAFRAGIIDTRQHIANARAQAEAVRDEARIADAESKAASAESRRISAIVQQTNAETAIRLRDALAVARAAAAKAGVYHIPAAILAGVVTTLSGAEHGTSTVACAPGFERACDDIANAFVLAGWQRPFVAKDASFFTGGGLDAVADSKPDAGLIIWYRVERADLAHLLAEVMKPAGFTIDLRAVPASPVEADIGFTVRFLDR